MSHRTVQRIGGSIACLVLVVGMGWGALSPSTARALPNCPANWTINRICPNGYSNVGGPITNDGSCTAVQPCYVCQSDQTPSERCYEQTQCTNDSQCPSDTTCENWGCQYGRWCQWTATGDASCGGSCALGACNGVSRPTDRECHVGLCEIWRGGCQYTKIADGFTCHPDSSPSSLGRCIDGLCEVPECTLDSMCNDGNECTIDRCMIGTYAGQCSASVLTPAEHAVPDGTLCAAGSMVCLSGMCRPPNCSVASDCATVGCQDKACINGGCVYSASGAGTMCTQPSSTPGYCDGAGECNQCSNISHCGVGQCCVGGACGACQGCLSVSPTTNPGESVYASLPMGTSESASVGTRLSFDRTDVYILVDTTNTMAGEISNLQQGVVAAINTITTTLPNAWIGVGAFQDDIGDNSWSDNVYDPLLPMTNPADPEGLLNIVGAANALFVRSGASGGDRPEGQAWALEIMAMGGDYPGFGDGRRRGTLVPGYRPRNTDQENDIYYCDNRNQPFGEYCGARQTHSWSRRVCTGDGRMEGVAGSRYCPVGKECCEDWQTCRDDLVAGQSQKICTPGVDSWEAGTRRDWCPGYTHKNEGPWGFPCFRQGTRPLVILITDAEAHNGSIGRAYRSNWWNFPNTGSQTCIDSGGGWYNEAGVAATAYQPPGTCAEGSPMPLRSPQGGKTHSAWGSFCPGHPSDPYRQYCFCPPNSYTSDPRYRDVRTEYESGGWYDDACRQYWSGTPNPWGDGTNGGSFGYCVPPAGTRWEQFGQRRCTTDADYTTAEPGPLPDRTVAEHGVNDNGILQHLREAGFQVVVIESSGNGGTCSPSASPGNPSCVNRSGTPCVGADSPCWNVDATSFNEARQMSWDLRAIGATGRALAYPIQDDGRTFAGDPVLGSRQSIASVVPELVSQGVLGREVDRVYLRVKGGAASPIHPFVFAMQTQAALPAECQSKDGTSYYRCVYGAQLDFDIQLNNAAVAATSVDQYFEGELEMVAVDSTGGVSNEEVLRLFPIAVRVPASTPSLPESGTYDRTTDSKTRCKCNEKAVWEEMRWEARLPAGTTLNLYFTHADEEADFSAPGHEPVLIASLTSTSGTAVPGPVVAPFTSPLLQGTISIDTWLSSLPSTDPLFQDAQRRALGGEFSKIRWELRSDAGRTLAPVLHDFTLRWTCVDDS